MFVALSVSTRDGLAADNPGIRAQQDEKAAPGGTPSGQPWPGNSSLVIPRVQPSQDESTLILPPLWQPTKSQPVPPVPPPLVEVTVPDPFAGCWQGRPDDYDKLYSIQPGLHAGRPGLVVICYHQRTMDMDADIVVPVALRAVELVMTAGLGHTSFHAHGIKTDVYYVSPTMMHGRTTLEVQRSFQLFHVIPIGVSPQPTTVDWNAALDGSNTLRVQAYQVVWLSGEPSFGATWHADFTRVAEGTGGSVR